MSKTPDEGQIIQEDIHEPSHFAMIPKMAMMELNPYELALYCHYKMTASENGRCWKSNKTIATETGMSERKVRDTRNELVKKGYITVTHTPDETGNINTPPTITIVNVWAKNRAKYAKKDAAPLHTVPTPPASHAAPPAHSATKEEPVKKIEEHIAPNGAGAKKPSHDGKSTAKKQTVPASEINPMKDAIVRSFGYSWDTMTKSEKGLVQATARELCLANAAPEQVAIVYAHCKARFTHFSPKALATHYSEVIKSTAAKPAAAPVQDAYSAWRAQTMADEARGGMNS